MPYRTILVELAGSGQVEARLHAAHALARRFDATLVGMHVIPSALEPAVMQGLAEACVGREMVEAVRRAELTARGRVRAAFASARGTGPAAVWRAAEGDPVALLARAARTADLMVAGRGEAGVAGRLVTVSGVPVLVLPPQVPAGGIGRTVLVAWNGSREAARAAHDALPFLTRGAGQVVLCAVGEEAGASLDDAAAMLGRHGVPLRAERVDGPDADAGAVLLARAAAHGADLLVMGAYGHSRLREFIFGGATRQALHEAPLPVLFGG
jgi:nucleotide-binding universal stress UspA family protein